MIFSSIHRQILPIALPTILMNISLPLLGAVDTAVMGQLGEVYLVGAVGMGSLVFSVLYWAFGFLRMGVVGLASQEFGRGDEAAYAAVLWRGLLLALALGIVLMLARTPIGWIAFRLIEASPEVEQHALEYFHIRVLAAPAVFVSMVFTGWFYGVRNILYPVCLQLGINLLNVALDFWFVMGLGFQTEGVAWATVIAQYTGLAATLALFAWRYRPLLAHLQRRTIFNGVELRRLLTLNSDLFIRTASLLLAHSYFLSRSAAHGDRILAVNTILVQFRHITAYSLDGFATAAEVIVGAATGSGSREQLALAIRWSLIYGVLVGAIFSLIYVALGPWLLPLFTVNEDVLTLAESYMVWIIVEPLVSNICFIMDGIFIGATATRAMRNAMLITVFAVYFPLFWWMEPHFGNHGMWATTLVLYAVRAVTLAWPLYRLTTAEGHPA